ncbi:MAG: hypothetical protein AAGE99_04365, partial [Chlamydiota bacterium]
KIRQLKEMIETQKKLTDEREIELSEKESKIMLLEDEINRQAEEIRKLNGLIKWSSFKLISLTLLCSVYFAHRFFNTPDFHTKVN